MKIGIFFISSFNRKLSSILSSFPPLELCHPRSYVQFLYFSHFLFFFFLYYFIIIIVDICLNFNFTLSMTQDEKKGPWLIISRQTISLQLLSLIININSVVECLSFLCYVFISFGSYVRTHK